MIDWNLVLTNSLWLIGLAILLTVVSFSDYSVTRAGRSRGATWRAVTHNGWSYTGCLLFCAGMGLTSDSWVERGGWALLGAAALYGGWRASLAQTKAPPARNPDLTSNPDGISASVGAGSFLERAAERVIGLELLWLVLMSPFFFFPRPSFVPALAALPLLWLIRRIARGRFLPRTPLDWPIALLLFMLLVSIFVTPDLGFSLDKITNLLFGIGVYYAVADWITTPGRLGWASVGYALAGTAMAIIGLLGTDWANKIPLFSSITTRLPGVLRELSRAPGGFNANITGGSLLWVVPLQVALVWWAFAAGPVDHRLRLLLRVLLPVCLVVSAGTLALSQSRGALLGLALGTGLLLWLAGRWARLLVAAGLALTIIAVVYIGPQKITDKLLDAPGNSALSVSNSLQSGQQRLAIWSRALYGIEDFPFTGMGMHAFRRVMPVLYPLFSQDVEYYVGHAHNQFLQAALDLGLPGLIAFLALWMGAAASAVRGWQSAEWRVRSEPTGSLRKAMAAGIAACLAAYFVFGLTDLVVLGDKRGFFFWALLALLPSLWEQSRPALTLNHTDEGVSQGRGEEKYDGGEAA